MIEMLWPTNSLKELVCTACRKPELVSLEIDCPEDWQKRSINYEDLQGEVLLCPDCNLYIKKDVVNGQVKHRYLFTIKGYKK